MMWRTPAGKRVQRTSLLARARCALGVGLALAATVAIAGEIPAPELQPLAPNDPGWRELAQRFVDQGDVTANFAEQRYFPFRKQPVLLTGEVRVSAEHGLSLHYRTPEQRIVIVDREGLLIREPSGQAGVPSDPRAAAINDALLHILTLDIAALEQPFEVFGRRDGANWTLELVPKLAELRHAIERITVSGVDGVVAHIELRHSPKQYIDIQMSQPFPSRPFSAEELRQYFR